MAKKRKNLPEVVPELFEHEEFGQFRFIKRGEEIWFAAVDICRVLDLSNVTKALYVLDNDEKMTLTISKGQTNEKEKMTVVLTDGQKMTLFLNEGHSDKRGGAQFMNFVSEPGMYRLIFQSRKPEAKKFQRWVTHEVLPSIRKYGYYGVLTLAITNKDGKVLLNLPPELYDKNKSDFVNMMNIFAYIEKE